LKESETILTQKVQSLMSEYNIKVAELESSKNKLEDEVASYEKQVSELAQKEKIRDAESLVNERSYVEAAQILYNVASSQLDEVSKSQFEQLKQITYPSANETLYNEGVSLYNQDNLVEANARFEAILLYEPDERMARQSLYYIGCIYEKNNELENAKKYFQKIVADYSDTREARNATAKLEGMAFDS